ncbi:hypothetical protein, partial [Propylenella binzhouense]|uniref:hypothetical protein n=1 Tax=Propylenella binzhouense TaxID=2555902 RepID=UPI001967409A
AFAVAAGTIAAATAAAARAVAESAAAAGAEAAAHVTAELALGAKLTLSATPRPAIPITAARRIQKLVVVAAAIPSVHHSTSPLEEEK